MHNYPGWLVTLILDSLHRRPYFAKMLEISRTGSFFLDKTEHVLLTTEDGTMKAVVQIRTIS